MGTWPKVRPRRIRMITCDVTGTLVSFRGTLEEHYLGSAEKLGVQLDSSAPFGKAFNQAYKEMSKRYPCFGANEISAKDWWRKTVLRSFELAGALDMTEAQQDALFQRIYSIFGSLRAYEKFDDTLPFLHFMGRQNVVCGILSNADDRYGDSILPMLGVTHDELHFQCFSKDYGFEKPDPRFFAAALERGNSILARNSEDTLIPGHCLHIGNDYTKDFEGARRAGMHAILLDRYNEEELAAEWKRRGAIVFHDLMDVVMWLGQSGCQLG
ncbi:hypothetical protein ACA910_004150 [Epithemia clementina (nom. ined.)]